jgi:propionyl-CoA carboxylase alpha chain
MFKKILIANRGEIAVRVIRACKELGIKACVVYSDIDSSSLHVRMADESYLIGSASPEDSYLNIPKIVKTAIDNSIDAVHPGYGFLSENNKFIEALEKAGIVFIGPNSDVVKLMGDKLEARKFINSLGIPIVPGTIEPTNDPEKVISISNEIGYPLIIKAAAGGGGKGMRKINSAAETANAIERAQSEALKAFNDDKMYIEKLIIDPRHIEVQVLSDKHGKHLHLFERECSIQRRHQKIIEEAPSKSISENLREKITQAAVSITSAANYVNAGTIEFLVDEKENYYFLEMNTRLQVEHPVTEAITGVDLVKEQIRIANGDKLTLRQENIKINGHAIECRINAEDPFNNFFPSIGKIGYFCVPSGPGVRVDYGIKPNSLVTLNYDPLITKVIVHATERSSAIQKMVTALKEFKLSGVITNLPVHLWILSNIKFLNAQYHINFLEDNFSPENVLNNDMDEEKIIASALLSVFLKEKKGELSPGKITVSNNNKWFVNE